PQTFEPGIEIMEVKRRGLQEKMSIRRLFESTRQRLFSMRNRTCNSRKFLTNTGRKDQKRFTHNGMPSFSITEARSGRQQFISTRSIGISGSRLPMAASARHVSSGRNPQTARSTSDQREN